MYIQCEFYKKNVVGGHHGQREGQPHGPQHLSYVYVEKCRKMGNIIVGQSQISRTLIFKLQILSEI